MMATTHAFASTALVALTLPVTARHAPSSSLLAVAFVAGLLPDLDLVTNHRKTLHFPVVLPLGAVACLLCYGAFGWRPLVFLCVAASAAGLHAATDVLGGGIGYEPWHNDSEKAVYNHVLRRWHAPRRFVRYSGAPEDFLLGAALGVPLVLAPSTGPWFDGLLIAVLVGSGAYAATRRRFSAVARLLRARLPAGVLDRLPAIRFEDG